MENDKEEKEMAKAGDEFVVLFNSAAPLKWGTNRQKNTRPKRTGERYIPIPRKAAKEFSIRNSNSGTGLGINIFKAHSADGVFHGELKATGCSKAGDVYAKQFEGNGDLKALEPWLTGCNAEIGDQVKVRWVTDSEIELTFIAHH